jgi:hypothetical protein
MLAAAGSLAVPAATAFPQEETSMLRVLGVSLVLALAAGPLAAQQANTPNATLTFNLQNHPAAGTGPIATTVAPGGAFVIGLSGLPLSRLILVGSAPNLPGIPIPPFGILDVVFPFTVILDGFQPQTFFDFFARTSGSGNFELAGAFDPTFPSTLLGVQAALEDPTAPGGGRLTAAAAVTVSPLTTVTVTFPESQLGDDVTVTYFHQALRFPFYGTAYGRTNIDTNGYLSFGPQVPSQWFVTAPAFLSGPPRIAPYWSDLHMSSTVPSAFGFVSVAPASIVVTESNAGGGTVVLQVDWLFATEATLPPGVGMGTPGNRFDFRVQLDSAGTIVCTYGPGLGAGFQIPATGQVQSIVGISAGMNRGTNTAARDLVVGGSVSPFATIAPYDPIFELLSGAGFGIDFVGPPQGVRFAPQGLTPPLDLFYTLF